MLAAMALSACQSTGNSSSAPSDKPIGENSIIESRIGNGVTYVGKWGGQVHASVEILTPTLLRACYGDQPCFDRVPYEVIGGNVVAENGPHKWVYQPVPDGFDATYYKDGSKLSGAALR